MSDADAYVVVCERFDWNAIPLVDRAGVWTGRKATQIEQYGEAFLNENPLIKAGLNVASLTLTVAGGPTKYVAGKVFDSFKNEIQSYVTDGYSEAGWDAENSALGGKGVVLAGSILLSGMAAIRAGFSKGATVESKKPVSYDRPSTFRAGVRNEAWNSAAETAVPQVTANRLAGNAFRDEIAAALRAEGRGVQTEVYKMTPFGARYMDIEVRDVPGGTVLGGIETKLGNSRYTPSQRAKDMFLKIWENYPVNVVREPR